MENKYLIRRAYNKNDINKISKLLNSVFYPDTVGDLAETISNYLPGMSYQNWYVAEEKETTAIVAAFVLIPWEWEMLGVKLKVAEMGMVATYEKHRSRGLMKLLNTEFNKTLEDEYFDLAVIQGIPGFYHKFGYHYSVPMENHLNIDVKLINDSFSSEEFQFYMATKQDISFLMEEDVNYRESNFLSVYRSSAQWEYILNYGKETDYGSDVLIFGSLNEKNYCRILYQGFGKGLIVSEVSSSISENAFKSLLNYLKNRAVNEGKPFIRFNIANDSKASKYLVAMGIEESKSYAWQIKVPNKKRLLKALIPIFELRLGHSNYKDLSSTLRLDFYSEAIDINFNNGNVISIECANEHEVDQVFCIPDDLFASLVLAHKNWEQLQLHRPDIAPMNLYLNPEINPFEDKTLKLINVLFPKMYSWIYLQY